MLKPKARPIEPERNEIRESMEEAVRVTRITMVGDTGQCCSLGFCSKWKVELPWAARISVIFSHTEEALNWARKNTPLLCVHFTVVV